MKKFFWSMLSFLMLTMLSTSFVACGSDDEENPNNGGGGSTPEQGTTLVGNWYCNEEYPENDVQNQFLVIFNSNNTFKMQTHNYEAGVQDYKATLEGTYDYNANTGKITIRVTSSSDHEEYPVGAVLERFVESLTSNRLVMTVRDEAEGVLTYDLTKTTMTSLFEGTAANNKFVGNWLYEEDEPGYNFKRLLIFKSDGTFISYWKEIETGDPVEQSMAKGTYTYSASSSTLTLHITKTNETETWNVVSITASSFIAGYYEDGYYEEDSYTKTNLTSL